MKHISKVLNKISAIKLTGAPRAIIYAYTFFVVVCVLVFMSAWIQNWQAGKPDLPMLNTFIQTVTGGAFVAAVLFMVKGHSDKDEDNDGVPDDLEGK